jgi:hypothetical protein
VGILGGISLFFFSVFIGLAHGLKPGEDAIEPMVLLVAPIVVNMSYTGGWVLELLLRILRPKESAQIGPVLMKAWVGFSVVMLLLPSAFWFLIWVAGSA